MIKLKSHLPVEGAELEPAQGRPPAVTVDFPIFVRRGTVSYDGKTSGFQIVIKKREPTSDFKLRPVRREGEESATLSVPDFSVNVRPRARTDFSIVVRKRSR